MTAPRRAQSKTYPIDEVPIWIVSRLVIGEVTFQSREVFHLQGESSEKRLPEATASSFRAYSEIKWRATYSG